MQKTKQSISEAAQKLEAAYRAFGYSRYTMSKFEEYDLYLANKNFLVSDAVITFTDFNGKLMALKPDVTLSIVKNYSAEDGTQKLFYDENVYRAAKGAREVKEMRQLGLECIGKVGSYQAAEVVSLAAKSLSALGENWVLDLSHMGFISGLLSALSVGASAEKEILRCIGEKNPHDMLRICKENGVESSLAEKLAALAELNGGLEAELPNIAALSINAATDKAMQELSEIAEMLKILGCSENIRLDFSVVNDMSYYDGIVFQGYLEGIPMTVLSGGSYDPLLKKLGKYAGAIGFAVYLGLLERYFTHKAEYDTDVLLIAEESDSPVDIAKAAASLAGKGFTIRVDNTVNIRSKFVMKVSDALQQSGL
ncbi:MAG: ATP phosphoribosyltransferase regulatory subunit [Christensenellaceae bacterium]|nr:ATP phosphoribosyltransferase regulatory subunit [Christensenellaceae bacterium]